MNFQRESGTPKILPYPKTASTAFADGDAVAVTSGKLVKAAAATTPKTLIGIITRAVVSTDDDYADETMVGVEVPALNDEFRAVVGTGTATAAMVGGRYDLDADGQVNVSAQLTQVVEIVRFISATEVVVKFPAEVLEA